MILRFCICIPTYNNPATIESVVKDCLERTPYPILVVDDGSTVPIQIAHERVTVHRLESNQGKGVALQTGFRECLKKGFTHVVAIDGDGQHLASEISKLVSISLENPWDLVIGCRKLVSANVPEISKFGRNFSNFWVRFQTDHPISDSQSGFRIYPLFQVQNLKFWTKKFDFEIEVLIRLLWRGVTVREAEIECYYPSPEERVSHFRKFSDNARISFLNTILVVLSLLRIHREPREIGLAVGVGVWIGCTPFFGFHTLIAAALALVFRLNAVYVWLGTQISIPPLAPFLAIASIAIGARITQSQWHVHSNSAGIFSWNWLLGSVILGAGLGVLSGLGSYFAAKKIQRRGPAKKTSWNGKTRGGKLGNGFLKAVTRYAGLKPAYFCLIFVVPYFYLFAPKARRSALEYWHVVRPSDNCFTRQWRVIAQFFRFAQTLLDRVYQGFHTEPCFTINPDGIENILTPVRDGKGLILVSAHVGSWDMAAAALKADGLEKQFHVVKYESQGMTFDKVKKQNEPEHVKKLISNEAQTPVLQIRELLARGLPVALMGDRPIGNHFELVSFFGKLAPVDCTPFRIAAACDAPLLFTFGFKGRKESPKGSPKDSYDFYATPSRYYRSESGTEKQLQMVSWAQEYAAVLEQLVRKYPDQWFNFFQYWSAVPAPPEDVQATPARNYSLEQLRKPIPTKPARESVPRSIDEIESRP
jgi:predicted LPLAT superfamily acyltransferase/uncharacterized protein (DUF2062 family)